MEKLSKSEHEHSKVMSRDRLKQIPKLIFVRRCFWVVIRELGDKKCIIWLLVKSQGNDFINTMLVREMLVVHVKNR